jgi:hypothetical protein
MICWYACLGGWEYLFLHTGDHDPALPECRASDSWREHNRTVRGIGREAFGHADGWSMSGKRSAIVSWLK